MSRLETSSFEIVVRMLWRSRPVILLTFALAACGDEVLDTTRRTEPRGSLGEEIFKLLQRDLIREDARRADGFTHQHDEFVAAIDHLFPPNELSYTQAFLEKLLPLYDDNTIPDTTERLAAA